MQSSRSKSLTLPSSPRPRPGGANRGANDAAAASASLNDAHRDLEAKAAETTHSKQRQKLVRDSFTIPKGEYALLARLKDRALRLVVPVKKSELLRAGIYALSVMPDREFLATLGAIPSLKPGRPKNGGEEPTEANPKSARHRSKRR